MSVDRVSTVSGLEVGEALRFLHTGGASCSWTLADQPHVTKPNLDELVKPWLGTQDHRSFSHGVVGISEIVVVALFVTN